ncbi:hypothetical protein EDC04DRAFT_2719646 [Pisolithus marmoratus]|nr:hypothetical protein EDC04DRAFT_2719646 [Pisolithus marmoratus]
MRCVLVHYVVALFLARLTVVNGRHGIRRYRGLPSQTYNNKHRRKDGCTHPVRIGADRRSPDTWKCLLMRPREDTSN